MTFPKDCFYGGHDVPLSTIGKEEAQVRVPPLVMFGVQGVQRIASTKGKKDFFRSTLARLSLSQQMHAVPVLVGARVWPVNQLMHFAQDASIVSRRSLIIPHPPLEQSAADMLEGEGIEMVFCSPLQRAAFGAACVADKLGGSTPSPVSHVTLGRLGPRL